MFPREGRMDDSRRIELLPLEDIAPAAANPKRHREADIQASISRHGYVEPVILDERTGRLVAGHGRVAALAAMRAAGQSPPRGVADDDGRWLVPVLRGWSSTSDAEADAYLLASNRLVEAGGWDPEELHQMLTALDDGGAELAGLGWSEDELEQLLEPPEEERAVAERPEGDHGISVDQAKVRYDATTLRQVVLVFDATEYGEAVSLLESERAARGLETNTEAVMALLREARASRAPAEPPAPAA
jgi:hypothetical protein